MRTGPSRNDDNVLIRARFSVLFRSPMIFSIVFPETRVFEICFKKIQRSIGLLRKAVGFFEVGDPTSKSGS